MPSKSLASFGALDITDLKSFLEQSRIEFQNNREVTNSSNESIKDYNILVFVRSGTYGKVYLVKNKNTKKLYAAKKISISKILESNLFVKIKQEKSIMQRLNFPFTVRLVHFACNSRYIYFIEPFYNGGDLLENIQSRGRFEEYQSRFLGAQVVLGLEYLHYLDIIHRDLKPENVILDHTGYIKLVDFGFAKIVKARTYSLCGSPGYMAPEILCNKGYGKTVDWWALGVFLFEITHGEMPAMVRDIVKFVKDGKEFECKMPSHFSAELSDLLHNLLTFDLSKRFGNLKNGVNDIKDHVWFRPILWLSLLNRSLQPPYKLMKKSVSQNSDDIYPELDCCSKQSETEGQMDLLSDF